MSESERVKEILREICVCVYGIFGAVGAVAAAIAFTYATTGCWLFSLLLLLLLFALISVFLRILSISLSIYRCHTPSTSARVSYRRLCYCLTERYWDHFKTHTPCVVYTFTKFTSSSSFRTRVMHLPKAEEKKSGAFSLWWTNGSSRLVLWPSVLWPLKHHSVLAHMFATYTQKHTPVSTPYHLLSWYK